MERLREQIEVSKPLLARVAEQPLDLRADVQRRAPLVEVVDVDVTTSGKRSMITWKSNRASGR
jgi:hypothetical protein